MKDKEDLELFEVLLKIPVKIFCTSEINGSIYLVQANLNVLINLN
jgi:hypothetical protein